MPQVLWPVLRLDEIQPKEIVKSPEIESYVYDTQFMTCFDWPNRTMRRGRKDGLLCKLQWDTHVPTGERWNDPVSQCTYKSILQ